MTEPDNHSEARVALFQSREIRRTLHNDEWWFVITDIVAALTDAADPSDYWKKMRRRLCWWTTLQPMVLPNPPTLARQN